MSGTTLGLGRATTLAPTYTDKTNAELSLTTDGKLRVDATLQTGDIEIGAVEIKNGSSDQRATVDSNGALSVNQSLVARTFADSGVSVGVASGTVVSTNSSRKGLFITNTSTSATVSLNITDAAVLYQGITLVPGATWNMDANSFTTAAITGIASAAATAVSVMELT